MTYEGRRPDAFDPSHCRAVPVPRRMASAEPTEDARYLTTLKAPSWKPVGEHQAITRRALTCIAQLLTPGVVDAPSVRSSDIEAGTIVATNSFHYTYGLLQVGSGHTTLTFEARDGPFRVTHTNISNCWTPIRDGGRSALGDSPVETLRRPRLRGLLRA